MTLSAALCEKPDLEQAKLSAARAARLADRLTERREEIRALAEVQLVVVEYLAAPKSASALVPRLREASDDLTNAIGRTHPKSIEAQQTLAFILGAAGKTEDSIQLFERSLDNAEARFGPNNAAVADQRKNLALGYKTAGRITDAEPIIRARSKYSGKQGATAMSPLVTLSSISA